MSKVMQNAVSTAEKNIRKRELEKEALIEEKKKNLLQELEDLTGEKHAVYKPKPQNSQVAFAQIIQHNLQLLLEIGYLTPSEETFLFRISAFLDFKSNIIVEKEYKNKKKKDRDPNELPKAASITYIANIIGLSREYTSKLMKGLKVKGILGNTEAGMTTENGRVCTARTWVVNPHIMYCGDKGHIEQMLKMTFAKSLKNLKDKNGKKVKLPVILFYETAD